MIFCRIGWNVSRKHITLISNHRTLVSVLQISASPFQLIVVIWPSNPNPLWVRCSNIMQLQKSHQCHEKKRLRQTLSPSSREDPPRISNQEDHVEIWFWIDDDHTRYFGQRHNEPNVGPRRTLVDRLRHSHCKCTETQRTFESPRECFESLAIRKREEEVFLKRYCCSNGPRTPDCWWICCMQTKPLFLWIRDWRRDSATKFHPFDPPSSCCASVPRHRHHRVRLSPPHIWRGWATRLLLPRPPGSVQ